MTSWYKAVCDEHKEYCSIFCVTTQAVPLDKIQWPLGESAPEAANQFLTDHWTCKLRLVRDDNEDDAPDYVDRTPP